MFDRPDDGPDAICVLDLGQFGLKRADLPAMENERNLVDGALYRSTRHPKHVFVWRHDHWDCFVCA